MLKYFAKFSVVGVSGVAINMAVYTFFIHLGYDYLFAAVISFCAAVTNNFYWNLIWTFKGRAMDKSIRQKYVSFFAVSALNLGLNLLVLHILVEYAAMAKTIAQFFAIGAASVFNFLLNYKITFRDNGDRGKRGQLCP